MIECDKPNCEVGAYRNQVPMPINGRVRCIDACIADLVAALNAGGGREMKEQELRDSAICAMCGHPIGHSVSPLFYRVTVEQFLVDMQAVHRQQGLAMALGGNAALAHVMGPGEDMAQSVGEPARFTVCQNCSHEPIYADSPRELPSGEKE